MDKRRAFLDIAFPDSARSIERLLFHLTPAQQAILYEMLEYNRDREKVPYDDMSPMAVEHDALQRRIEFWIRADGNPGQFESMRKIAKKLLDSFTQSK